MHDPRCCASRIPPETGLPGQSGGALPASAGRFAGAGGVTLIELMIAVVVVAVLSGTAISLLSGGHKQTAAEEAARRIATDVSFAQSDAIAGHAERLVIFDEAGERYAIHTGGAVMTHPVSKKPFAVNLANTFHGVGIDLSAVSFGGSDTLRFNDRGIPDDGGSVTVSAGGMSWTVIVGAGTGRVTVTG